jgi:Xylose isomerase-like TIM barrel/Major Facilitator Superfamily
MSPQTLAIIGTIFPERGERARALGIWSGTSGLALVLEPLIGGMLASRWGWQSIFWLNVPLGAAAIVLGTRTIPAPATSRSHGIDVLGQLLAIAVLVGLSFAIVNAGGSAWLSAPVLVPLCAAAAVPALVYTERRSAEPMLPPPVRARHTGTVAGRGPAERLLSRLVAGLARSRDVAAALGVRITVEYKPGTLIGDCEAALMLAVDVPGTGVLLDTGHAHAAGEDPADVIKRLGELLWHIHLGDAKAGAEDDDLPLGQVPSAAPMVAALADTGFAGVASFDLYGAACSAGWTGAGTVAASLDHLNGLL